MEEIKAAGIRIFGLGKCNNTGDRLIIFCEEICLLPTPVSSSRFYIGTLPDAQHYDQFDCLIETGDEGLKSSQAR